MASSDNLSGKLEAILELKSPADKYWDACKNLSTLLPKIYPEVFKSITDIVGDGRSPGSVRFLQYVEGHPIGSATERIHTVDDENMRATYSVIDGDIIGGFFTKFKPAGQVIPKADGGCTVIWSVEYEKANEEVPDPHVVIEFIIDTAHRIDEYLQKSLGHPIGSATERIDTVDDENKIVTYSVIDGDIIGGFFTDFKPRWQVIPKVDGGCMAIYSVEYEKANEDVPVPHIAIEFITDTAHRIDEYLQKA